LTKGLKEGEYLLYDIKVEGNKRTSRTELLNLSRQSPNTRIPLLNTSMGVAIYRFGEWTYDSTKHLENKQRYEAERKELLEIEENENLDKKQRKRLFKLNNNIASLEKRLEYGNFFMRTGNPPVIYDSTKAEESSRQMAYFLLNNGFFDASTDFSVEKRRKRATVTYLIVENEPYKIDSFYTRSDDENIYEILQRNQRRTNIKVRGIYNQSAISQERQRVEDLLKENGYYTFSRSYIEYNVYKDTLEKSVVIEQVIRKPSFADIHQVYFLDSVYFSIDPPSSEFVDEGIKTEFRDINFELYRDKYSEKIIASRIFLNKGDLYSRRDVIETQRQLANLDLFRFVNIAFDTLGNTLRPRIYTQPNQKYQITNQMGASITEQIPGPFFSHSLRNRNLFRGAEIFEFFFRAGLEGVVSFTGEGGVFRSRELNTSASIIFPQFLFFA